MKKRIVLLLLCFLLFIFSVPVCATEEKPTVILSLGDSISAGYGLATTEETFVYNILEKGGQVENYAVNGNTAENVWQQLQNPENEKYVDAEKIKNSNIVTITCGGNDLMAVLYSKIAETWNKANPENKIEVSEVLLKLSQGDLGLLMTAAGLFDALGNNYLITDPDFEAELEKYTETLKKITSYVNLVNPECAVVVATQYNPYVEFENTLLDIVYKGMEDGVNKLNGAIEKNASDGGYMVSPVKSKFDSYSGDGDLYNADVNSMNVDFHPSAHGHKVLAESFKETISQIKYVSYKVYHCYEALDGSYAEIALEQKAVAGVNLTAKPQDVEGFTLITHSDEIKSARAEENVALKLYYSRNVYSVSWKGADAVTVEEYKYGEKITPAALKRKGYKFTGWDKEVPETMPAEDLTFAANWKKNLNAFSGVIVVGLIVALAVISRKKKKS